MTLTKTVFERQLEKNLNSSGFQRREKLKTEYQEPL